jgi:SAM-dependent methyltransferase
MHFEAHAEVYARARPPYPPALWDRLRGRGLLAPGRTVLDLGAGSGQATGPLLEAGLRVTAVEPGPALAAQLASRHPPAEVVTARAEDAELGEARYDLVVAATSIHWMDLDIVLPKVHTALKPNGRLLVWRNVFGDAMAPVTAFREKVADIVAARAAPPRTGTSAEDVEATISALTRDGLFAVEDLADFHWTIDLDARSLGLLFSTFSDWTAAEVAQAVDAVRTLGGRVTEHYSSWLIVLSPLR